MDTCISELIKMPKTLMYSFVSEKRPNPLGGGCYSCTFCYIHGNKGMKKRFKHIKNKYSGEFKLYPTMLRQIINVRRGKPVFFCDCIDYLHEDNSVNNILEIFSHIKNNKHDTLFLSLTKNPARYIEFIEHIPKNMILGATIESNIDHHIYSNAPSQTKRIKAMNDLYYELQSNGKNNLTFWSIEPILMFDLNEFINIIEHNSPTYGVAIGYDNHNHGLNEPTYKDTMGLIHHLVTYGMRVIEKTLRKAWWEK